MTEGIAALARALALTLVIEAAAAFAAGVREKRDFALICGANMITNPAMNILLSAAVLRLNGNEVYSVLALVLLETAVVFAEYAIFRKTLIYRRIPPLAFSALINAASFILGALIYRFVFNETQFGSLHIF